MRKLNAVLVPVLVFLHQIDALYSPHASFNVRVKLTAASPSIIRMELTHPMTTLVSVVK